MILGMKSHPAQLAQIHDVTALIQHREALQMGQFQETVRGGKRYNDVINQKSADGNRDVFF